jgi:hypothetical protein
LKRFFFDTLFKVSFYAKSEGGLQVSQVGSFKWHKKGFVKPYKNVFLEAFMKKKSVFWGVLGIVLAAGVCWA